ncbi:MAG TPA: carboxypeptidase regulatory-like domain-containing protein [Vicinamibacterales bacterium]|nr:carboxypeptidase regulatory-like domain-containing protein [Vicinamibacterales bacterium]
MTLLPFTLALALLAQQPATATLRVTVVDQTNAVVIGATVTVTGTDEATKGATIAPVQTTDQGVAIVPGLAPGRYTIAADFPGFEKRVLAEVRIHAGENRQVAILSIQRMETSVTVEQDKQQAASDRNGPSFGTTLTRDQIDALSDDPATLQQQLQDMAGPGAVIRIDGFEGGALPPKAMIRSIRIARDQFAAEFHSAGGVSIEIITQPGIGPMRYFSNVQVRDGGLSGRSPFVPVKGPEENVNYGFGLGGTLVENKSSFFLNAFGISAYDTPNLNAAVPGGTIARALSLKAPRDNQFISAQLDYALTLDQTLRFGYNQARTTNDNLGVGGYDEPDRAFSTHNAVNTFRVQHFGPVGRRAFWRSRVQLFTSDSTSASANETPTTRVLDAFTSGGAQRAGGDHAKTLNVASDFDYVRGRNSMRAGFVLDSTWYHSDSTANYLGTYTFANLQSYLANQPINFSRRIGDPNIAYDNVQGGIYVQDDIRVRKNLTLTPGVRYELQTHVHAFDNIGPRFGATWAPAKSGQTTLRGSVGLFYDWLPTSTYDQVVRVDGLHQQEINVINPSFPVAIVGGLVPPVNRYLLDSSFATPRIARVSAGVDQVLLKVIRASVTYSYQRGSRLARGANLNAPTSGVRPDATFADIIDVVSDAASVQHQVQVDANVNPGALLPLRSTAPRISWKRATVFANYTLASVRNNTDGPFSVSPTGTLDTEWGPSTGGGGGGGGFVPGVFTFGSSSNSIDIRHRANVSFNNQIVRNLLLAVNVNASSAPPYTLLTGVDTNGDGIFNDRPVGVGRGTLRASGQVTVNTMFGYVFTFGKIATPLPPGIGIFGQGAAAQVRTVDQGNARYRLQLFVQAQNLTNERNYLGYSGTLTSPFFGQPTAVSGMRKIDIGIALNF